MFTKNTYLIPQDPSSLYSANGVELFLHHHHHHPDLFTGHILTANAPLVEASTLLNQENGGPNGVPYPVANTVQRKPMRKKDRHSKIYTSQGPRDRRVRLSIGIARKFFDLQEMLCFDKPSKTLDWLLTKSKAAIKELVQSKHTGCGSGKSSSECELLSSAGHDETSENRKNGGKDSGMDTVSNLAKESRAKARARARERTREKMCIKQLSFGLNTSIPVQSRRNQLEFFQLSAGTNGDNIVSLNNEDLMQDSIVIKRKAKNPSFFGQNVNSSSNYITPSGNATENWDVCSFTSQSNLYAILDQHKFINSNSNI